MNDQERSDWILNDETLYRWWKQAKGSMRAFIKENRDEIDKYIVENYKKAVSQIERRIKNV